jgi:hypothetical protein
MTVWGWQAIGDSPAGYDSLGLDLPMTTEPMTTEGAQHDDRSR